MRKCVLVSIATVIACLAWNVLAAEAQTAASTPPNFSGVWRLKVGPKLSGARDTTVLSVDTRSALQPWAEERCKVIGCGEGSNSAGVPTGQQYFEQYDPVLIKCAPKGFPRVLLEGAMEIVQSPTRLLVLWEPRDARRQIWTDGRKHTEDPYLWMGESIGRWEGDTLVVDTIGLNEHTWLDEAGHPHSDALHIVERMRKTDAKTMQVDITLEDSKAFTKPVKGTLIYELAAGKAQLEEYIVCEDRILSDKVEDAWPYFVGDYPTPLFPRVPRK
jgi:hypothetical protein